MLDSFAGASEMMPGGRDVRVDAYVEGAPEFARPVLGKLRERVHEASGEVGETVKWGRPFFFYRGRIVANMAAFEGALQLWGLGTRGCGGAARGWVVGEGASGSLGRLTGVGDLPAKAQMLGWLRVAFEAAGEKASGEKPAPAGEGRRVAGRAAKEEVAVPEDLARGLGGVSGGAERFEAMSPSCRREYVEWIDEAKRAETRARRLAQTCVWVAEGKSRNWKYEGRV